MAAAVMSDDCDYCDALFLMANTAMIAEGTDYGLLNAVDAHNGTPVPRIWFDVLGIREIELFLDLSGCLDADVDAY